MSGWNLPPGCTTADIDRQVEWPDDREVCVCDCDAEEHIPDGTCQGGYYDYSHDDDGRWEREWIPCGCKEFRLR